MLPFAIYHEHPDWFRPLFAELDRRGIPFVRLDPRAHLYDPYWTRHAAYEQGYELPWPNQYVPVTGFTPRSAV